MNRLLASEQLTVKHKSEDIARVSIKIVDVLIKELKKAKNNLYKNIRNDSGFI